MIDLMDFHCSYPKGLIVAFTLKSTSSGSTAEGNESHGVADKTECKTDEGLDSSKNDSEKTVQIEETNLSKDEEIKESADDKNGEAVEKNDSGNEKSLEVEEQSMDDTVDEHEEAEEKPTAFQSRNNMNVVSREDLKAVFRKFGSVKVSHSFFLVLCSMERFNMIYFEFFLFSTLSISYSSPLFVLYITSFSCIIIVLFHSFYPRILP